MSKVKETITALTGSDGFGIIKVSRKENRNGTCNSLIIVFEFSLKVLAIASVTAIVLYAEPRKLIALLIFTAFIALIYFMMKD